MMLSKQIQDAIIELQSKYPEKRSALIPALHMAQTQLGYLPLEIQQNVAELFDLDPNEVYSVVTFYDMFFDKPVGKHVIHVCKNVSCMLRGADGIIKAMCHELNVKPRETTADGEFTIIPSECLGACDRAPMMIVDDTVVGPVKEESIKEIIKEAKKGPGHPSPVPAVEGSHG